MKKTIFTVITVATVTIFTACSKNVEQPSGKANSIHTGNTSNVTKKGGIIWGDSATTKTTTHP